MDFKVFTAGKDDAGRRLDRVIKKIFTESQINSNIHGLIRKKLIRLNGVKTEASVLLQEGDRIEAAAFLFSSNDSAKEKLTAVKTDFPYKILFKNPDILFIGKPAGINVQPAASEETSVSSVIKDFFSSADSLAFTPAPLHRLDKNTSGVLAVSMSMKGARWFSENISSHKIQKIYLAVLNGVIDAEETWTDSMEDSGEEKNFRTSKVFLNKKGQTDTAKECITTVKPIKSGLFCKKTVTFCQITILTGRKHQIRAQSAARNHPLTGDSAYGGGSGKFFLHAWKIKFPEDNPLLLPEEICCPLPSDFDEFLKTNLKIQSSADII
ncbi:RluA family pseudouridine synthase [Treponema sp.]|uniref:RluA family pseudouridine synthase n=1 Tax=Treponema sp. TaxID=166 RepID=UPI00257B43E5|nr:RluA family pseudouridine synthase [Treponema sp.]MBE6353891.1 RluA family pseudouridine synthase [Treponema sp.]